MKLKLKKVNIQICFFVASICAVMIIILLYFLNMAPFGDRSMTVGTLVFRN